MVVGREFGIQNPGKTSQAQTGWDAGGHAACKKIIKAPAVAESRNSRLLTTGLISSDERCIGLERCNFPKEKMKDVASKVLLKKFKRLCGDHCLAALFLRPLLEGPLFRRHRPGTVLAGDVPSFKAGLSKRADINSAEMSSQP